MEFNTIWGRNWWSFKHTLKLLGERKINAYELPIYADKLIKKLELSELFSSGKLIDIKGREPNNYYETTTSSQRYSELLKIKGKIFFLEQLNKNQSDFSFMLLTAFDSFTGSNHIQNKIKEVRDGPLPDSLNWQELTWTIPIELSEVRIGLEIFLPSFTGMLGFAPEVKERLYIELNQTQINVQIELDSLNKKDASWLASSDFWIKVDQAFKEVFSVDLRSVVSS